jgi:hypothetical protein
MLDNINRSRKDSRSGQHSILHIELGNETKDNPYPSTTFEGMTERYWSKKGTVSIKPLAPMLSGGDTEDADLNTTSLHVAEILEDLRLAERVERELGTTGHMPLGAIQVFACGRVVILQGHVPSYHLKNVAETTAADVVGVEEVHNNLEVSLDMLSVQKS